MPSRQSACPRRCQKEIRTVEKEEKITRTRGDDAKVERRKDMVDGRKRTKKRKCKLRHRVDRPPITLEIDIKYTNGNNTKATLPSSFPSPPLHLPLTNVLRQTQYLWNIFRGILHSFHSSSSLILSVPGHYPLCRSPACRHG